MTTSPPSSTTVTDDSAAATRRRRRRRRRDEPPTWELVRERNSIERLKHEKFPLDIVDELPQLIAAGYEAVPEEDIVRLNWFGLTHDKPKLGTFMVRIKAPGGRVTPAQLHGVGEIAVEFGEDYAELTTRQGLQLHDVRLDELPAVLERIRAIGLTTIGGEGDTVRNITSCPVGGLDRDELFDVQPVIDEVAAFFTGNPDYSNLPRKHKYTISACPAQCNAPGISDIALLGVLHEGREGFAVTVGGGLSNTPRLARDLGVFVPADEAVEVLRAITDTWQHDLKYRMSRAKSRIKFLVDDYGAEGVRAAVEERLGRRLTDHTAPAPTPNRHHLGIHAQRTDGFSYAGFSIPMGMVTGRQLIAIGDLVEEIGGVVRVTRQQGLTIGDVRADLLGRLLDGMRDIGFPIGRNQVYGTSIACTSHRFCNYSVAETKGKLGEILAVLDERHGDRVADLEVHMDGCPHACAQHWVGEIGLQGTTAKDPVTGDRVEAYDVALHGGLGAQLAIGRNVLRRVPTDQITDSVVRLVDAWLDEREQRLDPASLRFKDFCGLHDDETLAAIARGEATDVGEDVVEAVLPVVRVPGTLLHLSDGVDEIEVRAATVAQALAIVGADHPALVDELLVDGAVNPYLNLYVGDEDIRGLDGLDTPLGPGVELLILPALAGG